MSQEIQRRWSPTFVINNPRVLIVDIGDRLQQSRPDGRVNLWRQSVKHPDYAVLRSEVLPSKKLADRVRVDCLRTTLADGKPLSMRLWARSHPQSAASYIFRMALIDLQDMVEEVYQDQESYPEVC